MFITLPRYDQIDSSRLFIFYVTKHQTVIISRLTNVFFPALCVYISATTSLDLHQDINKKVNSNEKSKYYTNAYFYMSRMNELIVVHAQTRVSGSGGLLSYIGRKEEK